ncbi:MAG: leucine-rich repeat domain-containing protein [Bacteroidaceae bacterium]|nr:leucine-rich repeat domain-containing protein [Bacteroidaceae bacterium]
MKKFSLIFFLLLTAVVGRAEDFEVDGIYYNITSAEEHTVAVTFRGFTFHQYKNEYSGDVVIPESVTYESVTYSVTEIGTDAFYECRDLTSVTIPTSVTKIGNSAFGMCTSLASIDIPDSITEIGEGAFSACVKLTSISIPNGVTVIGNRVFKSCPNLTSIDIPDSVTEIGREAFEGCGLTSVIIPYAVTKIGYKAFSSTSLSSVIVSNSAITIDRYMFAPYLVSITIGLDSLSVPDSMTKIEQSAFTGFRLLDNVSLNGSVINIGSCAFSHCDALKTITFGNSVTEIDGESPFLSCRNLKDVYCLADTAPVADGRLFSGMEVKISSLTLHVPSASLQAYKTTYPWSDFGQIVAIDEGDGIEQLTSEEGHSAFKNPTVYDLSGRRTTKMQKGINLLRNADGRVKKVWQK